jgi:hypothetical protein
MIKEFNICPCCGLKSPILNITVPLHLSASSGCWARFGEILTREYTDQACMVVHHLTVDAYAVQHLLLEPTKAAISSLNTHLLALYLNRRRGWGLEQLRGARAQIAKKALLFGKWIEPPHSVSALTIDEIAKASNPRVHVHRVEEWANVVWESWAERYREIEELAATYAL